MKIQQKTIFIHSAIVFVSLVACYFSFPLIALPVLGYCFWGIAKVVALVIRDISPKSIRIMVGGILTVGLLLSVMIFVSLPLWIGLSWYQDTHPDYGESLPEYRWRGLVLHNASYFQAYSITLVEGELSEEQFLVLAEKAGWELSEINKPLKITQRAGSKIHKFKSSTEFSDTSEVLTITSGIKADYIRSNGGGYRVCFDRESSRLYYLSTPR